MESAEAVLATNVMPHPALTLFLPVRAKQEAQRLCVHPERYGGSGDLVVLSESDGFVELPPRVSRTLVRFRPWQ
jgi:molybdopterin biosynthesis enzyme